MKRPLLVNNAGVLASFGLLTSDTEAIARDFAVNFYGPLATTKAFLPALKRASSGGQAAVVNVLSVVSLANLPALGGYSASKAAASSVTQGLRVDLGQHGIRVHGVFAGAMDTDIFPDALSRQIATVWQQNPKQVERQLGGRAG